MATLTATVVKASPVEDHSTYRYHIDVQCGTSRWEVVKRFSEFDSLLQGLTASKYSGLPKLPSKTLLGSPTDPASIDARKTQLKNVLQDILFRADTRSSQLVRNFLAAELHTSDAPKQLQPEAVRTFEDPRFGVSGLSVSPTADLVLISHEDSTQLSRLGRVWSVVEPDELGATHIWCQSDRQWKRVYSRTYGTKVRSLCWEDTSRQFFLGMEDGKIEVFLMQGRDVEPKAVSSLDLHHKSPVTYLFASPRRLLSLGFDTAMRVIDVHTRELRCGGRLSKRMRSEADYPMSGYLDDAQDRAFVGTSAGDVLILDISRNPPSFLQVLELESAPVAMISTLRERLLVAHGDCISVWGLGEGSSSERLPKLGCHRCRNLSGDEVTICSVASAPDRDLIFGGFSDGSLAIWGEESEALVVIKAHQYEVNHLCWVNAASWGPMLLTGGGDGKVTMWRMPEDPLLAGEAPASVAFSDQIGEAAFGNSDVFRVDQPRVNPMALRGQDSESDDDIVDAFR